MTKCVLNLLKKVISFNLFVYSPYNPHNATQCIKSKCGVWRYLFHYGTIYLEGGHSTTCVSTPMAEPQPTCQRWVANLFQTYCGSTPFCKSFLTTSSFTYHAQSLEKRFSWHLIRRYFARSGLGIQWSFCVLFSNHGK